MAWIKSHQELGTHPKLQKFASALGVHRAQALGHLHMLWWWALDYADDGDLTGYDVTDIALGAGWEGDPDKFVHALAEAGRRGSSGFLDAVPDGWLIHDWDEHTGAELRAMRYKAKRANHTRWHAGRGLVVAGCDLCTTSSKESVKEPSGIPVGSHSDPQGNPDKTRQEKTTTRAPDPDFDRWWAEYPRKKAKKDAAKAWTAARKEASPEELLAGIANAKAEWARERRAPEHIPYPATWLRSGQWDDEPGTEVLTGGGQPWTEG